MNLFRPDFLKQLMLFTVLVMTIGMAGCSSARFMDEGEEMLSSVSLKSESRSVSPGTYRINVRQEANSRWFNLVKVPLGVYCLQSRDTTNRYSRFIRRIGEAPVKYDASLTELSRQSLLTALHNKGYLHARVSADTIKKKHKVNVYYTLHPGLRNNVEHIYHTFDNTEARNIVETTTPESKLYKGMPLDVSILNSERNRIVELMRNNGYYNVQKEFVSFRADTAANDYNVNLSLNMRKPAGVDSTKAYSIYKIRNVHIYEDILPGDTADTSYFHGIQMMYDKRIRLQRRVYNRHTFIRPDSIYKASNVTDTYRAINSLQAVNYSTIRMKEVKGDSSLLDCDIMVKLNTPNAVSMEVEGTNTAGNFGAALAFTYSNRNLFRGAETFSLKLRGAYEAITGLEGYNNENYVEYGVETNLRFPFLLLPGVSDRMKQRLRASSEVGLSYSSQDRPEFHRRGVTAAWTYRWTPVKHPGWQHRLDLLSVNYIFMPWISDTFRKEYLEGDDPRYAVLRASYENLFITKTGYSFTYNSLNTASAMGLFQTNGYQVKAGFEAAGNLLYGLSHLTNMRKDADGHYNLFNIAYSQYVRADFDFAKSFAINDHNSLALHTAFGIAIPYGNSSIIPYERRYAAGGANSVRGWNVRELGPGSFKGTDGKIDFINQSGNIKLDLSVEYRTLLFWQLHGALFIDAGNIWNTRNYAEQSGGQFQFNKFYKQIAVSYGLGFRLNLGYFILRFDGGMKAINPAIESGKGHYPLLHPKFSRDFTFHFAVGLPF